MSCRAFVPAVLLALVCAPAAARDGTQIYQRALASMVQIVGVSPEGRYRLGSGVVLPNGTVATNCHVTMRAKRVQLFLGDGSTARRQTADVRHDVCALEFPDLVRQPSALSASRRLRVGDRVFAVGYNGGKALSYQSGKVAELFEYDGGMVIKITAPFTHGASGGGLFDQDGRLVGLLTFFRVAEDEQISYFAVPVEWVQNLQAGTAREIGALPGVPFWADSIENQPSFLQAGALEADGRWDELATLARRWTQMRPEDAQAWVALGKANAKLGDRSGAAVAYRRAAELRAVHPAMAETGNR